MSRYRSQTEFQVSDDHAVVYNHHPYDPLTNEVTVQILAPTLPPEAKADVAKLIKRALDTRKVGTNYDTVLLPLDFWPLLQNSAIVTILAIVFVPAVWSMTDKVTAATVTGVIVGAWLCLAAMVGAAVIAHNRADSIKHPDENN